MKPFLLLLLNLFVLEVASQCNISTEFYISSAFCSQIEIVNTSVLDCPDASFTVEKIKYGYGTYDNLNHTGEFYSYDSMMYFNENITNAQINAFGSFEVLISLTVSMYDAGFNLITSDEYFDLAYTDDFLMFATAGSTPASDCFTNDGMIDVYVPAPIFPYDVYYFNYDSGESGFIGNANGASTTIDGLSPGTYGVDLMTNMGCQSFITIEVESASTSLQGHVFADLDASNSFSPGEPSLESQHFYIPELDLNIYTDANGFFDAGELPFGTYSLQYVDEDGSFTMNSSMTVSNAGCYHIPLMPLGVPIFQVHPAWSSNANIHCVNGYNPGVYIHNSGSISLFGSVTLSFDPMFTASDLSGAVPTSFINPGEVSWEVSNQIMGSSANYVCHIGGPGIDNIFESFPFTMHVVLYDGFGNLLYDQTWTKQPIIVCGYDPNDLTATPEGYTEAHYVLPADEIQFQIRFQNTGNAPAENVLIQDMIDPAVFDLTSFSFEQSSHSVSTRLHGDGLLEFEFDNIMLPDSFSNEAASHGYVVFNVTLHDDLVPGVVAYNTANIYFDNNPAVVTNTTFHTVFDCEMTGSPLPDFAQCEGTDFNTSLYTYALTDSSTWYVDDALYSTTDVLNMTNLNPGIWQIDHHMINPLCEVVDDFILTVEAVPYIEINDGGGVLIATSGNGFYQWFLDGQPILSADQNTYSPVENGLYTVQLTTLAGCVSTSAGYSFTSVEELSASQFIIYPIPASDFLTMEPIADMQQIRLLSMDGKLIMHWQNPQGRIRYQVNHLAQGLYLIEATDHSGRTFQKKISIQ